MSLRAQRGHDYMNWQTCMCGERGCGSYRPFGGALTMREYDKIGLWLEAELEYLRKRL